LEKKEIAVVRPDFEADIEDNSHFGSQSNLSIEKSTNVHLQVGDSDEVRIKKMKQAEEVNALKENLHRLEDIVLGL
jgi:hypothetical protein